MALVMPLDDLWHGGMRVVHLFLSYWPLCSFKYHLHDIHLEQLKALGMGGMVFYWFTSFFQDQFQSVVIGGEILPLVLTVQRPAPIHHQHETTEWTHPLPWNELSSIHWWYPTIHLCPSQIKWYYVHLIPVPEVQRFWVNPGKTRTLTCQGPLSSRPATFLVLDGVALTQMDPICNLEVLVGSQFLLRADSSHD